MLSAVYDYIFCQLCNCIGYGFILIKRQAFLTIIAEPYRLSKIPFSAVRSDDALQEFYEC